MKTLILYDSGYGNTAIIATAIRKTLSTVAHEVTQKSIKELTPPDISAYDLIIIGSPTQGGRPTKAIESWIKELPSVKNIPFAVFDTRFHAPDQGLGLRMLMKLIGYASDKMASMLQYKGAAVIGEPAGFIITDKKGPLKQGELERAHDWAMHVNDIVLQHTPN